MLATRAPIVLEWIVAAAATAALALAPSPSPSPGHRAPRTEQMLTVHVELASVPPTAPARAEPAVDCDAAMPTDVEQAYEARRFDDAALLAQAVRGCERTVQLLHLLGAEWTAAMAPGADAASRLVYLQRARSTDLSLGGEHADELDAAIATIASRAAQLYLISAKQSGCPAVAAAARALDDAALLGVHDAAGAREVERDRVALDCSER